MKPQHDGTLQELFSCIHQIACFYNTSIPAVFLPCTQLHAKEGCICNSWKTSVGRQQQTLQPLRTLLGPFSSEEGTRRHELLNTSSGGIREHDCHGLTLMVLRSIGSVMISW